MNRLRKSIFFVLLISFVIGVMSSNGWAQEDTKISNDRMNIVDLFIARPLGFIAFAGGTCLFVASLIFTLPTRSVGDSFNLFVVEPWKFAFVRDFPDESVY